MLALVFNQPEGAQPTPTPTQQQVPRGGIPPVIVHREEPVAVVTARPRAMPPAFARAATVEARGGARVASVSDAATVHVDASVASGGAFTATQSSVAEALTWPAPGTGRHNPSDEEVLLLRSFYPEMTVAKARRVAPLDRERDVVVAAREHIRSHAVEFLDHLRLLLTSKIRHLGKASKEDEQELEDTVDSADYASLKNAVQPQIRVVAKDGAAQALRQVGAVDLHRLLEQANDRAVAWAHKRAGEMVTEISETTRQRVRSLVARAEEEGWSNDELADELDDSGAFGDSRAEMIARTETAEADVQGNLIGWDESGVVSGKEWIVAQDSVCDVCAEFDGMVVGLDEDFPEGDPPAHPNCRCDVLPVLSEEDSAD